MYVIRFPSIQIHTSILYTHTYIGTIKICLNSLITLGCNIFFQIPRDRKVTQGEKSQKGCSYHMLLLFCETLPKCLHISLFLLKIWTFRIIYTYIIGTHTHSH